MRRWRLAYPLESSDVAFDPIAIVADVPRDDPGLGFQEYAAALADAIRGGEPPQFTIGVYGPWGSGKSSLLNAIASELADDERTLPVMFDAWRYERTGEIIVPLLYQIYSAIAASGDEPLTQRIGSALRAVVNSLTFNLGVVTFDPSKALAAAPSEDATLPRLEAAFARPFAELRDLSTALGDKRIVVLIDDLDRCSSSNVVALLEAINVAIDIPGFIFVLALDYDVLIRAVAQRYPHASGHVFIEKMVQVPFRVPRLNLPSEGFLEQLIPGWTRRHFGFSSRLERQVHDIATTVLNSNPRQIKRLINSLLVLGRIVARRNLDVHDELLCSLIALQLRWPESYRDFAEEVFTEDGHPHGVLTEGTDDDLAAFARTFIPADTPLTKLREVLHLTEVVVAQEPSPDEQAEADAGAMSEIREQNRAKLSAALADMGFRPNPRSHNLLGNDALPNFRIRLKRTVLRIDRKETVARSVWHGDRLLEERVPEWVHMSSYLLTRDPEIALAAVRELFEPGSG
jgi:hypothetical protein